MQSMKEICYKPCVRSERLPLPATLWNETQAETLWRNILTFVCRCFLYLGPLSDFSGHVGCHSLCFHLELCLVPMFWRASTEEAWVSSFSTSASFVAVRSRCVMLNGYHQFTLSLNLTTFMKETFHYCNIGSPGSGRHKQQSTFCEVHAPWQIMAPCRLENISGIGSSQCPTTSTARSRHGFSVGRPWLCMRIPFMPDPGLKLASWYILRISIIYNLSPKCWYTAFRPLFLGAISIKCSFLTFCCLCETREKRS